MITLAQAFYLIFGCIFVVVAIIVIPVAYVLRQADRANSLMQKNAELYVQLSRVSGSLSQLVEAMKECQDKQCPARRLGKQCSGYEPPPLKDIINLDSDD